MARLKSHGKELLRIERETDITDPQENITYRRVTRAYMSDGKVLQKIDVRWKPDQYRPTGEFYSFGWKVDGKANGMGQTQSHSEVSSLSSQRNDAAVT